MYDNYDDDQNILTNINRIRPLVLEEITDLLKNKCGDLKFPATVCLSITSQRDIDCSVPGYDEVGGVHAGSFCSVSVMIKQTSRPQWATAKILNRLRRKFREIRSLNKGRKLFD